MFELVMTPELEALKLSDPEEFKIRVSYMEDDYYRYQCGCSLCMGSPDEGDS